MKVAYDPTADALYLREAEDLRVEHTEEVAKDIYLDYDTEGNVVGIEILWLKERKADTSTLINTLYSHPSRG